MVKSVHIILNVRYDLMWPLFHVLMFTFYSEVVWIFMYHIYLNARYNVV